MHVKKNDLVMVITGKDAGKKGKVLVAMPKENRVVVEGVNMVTRHVRPRTAQQQGGRIVSEGAIHASNVMVVCPKCGVPTRTGHKVLDNNQKVRVCKKCKEAFEA